MASILRVLWSKAAKVVGKSRGFREEEAGFVGARGRFGGKCTDGRSVEIG